VVWNNEQQQGFMRFKAGMPANDPRRDQYQLWIFDAQRDERYPIDGGVFDVTPGQEVIVPIRAALRVKQPTLFAVTLEPPGGVVVSDRKHILVVAKVGG
jgi:anti-sigma-K factor RskA